MVKDTDPPPKPDDAQQSEQFKEIARKLESDESGESFERALDAIMPPKPQEATNLNIANCPCCNKELFRSVEVERGVYQKAGGSKFGADKDGTFLICQHCNCRIDLVQSGGSPGNPIQFEVSKIQRCKPANP